MAIFGELKIHKYEPGELNKWTCIEKLILGKLRENYSVHNNWHGAIEEMKPGLAKIARAMKTARDLSLLEYHANHAAKEFITEVARGGLIGNGKYFTVDMPTHFIDHPNQGLVGKN